MAKKKNSGRGLGTVEFFEDLEERTIQWGDFIQKNAKLLGVIIGVIFLGIIGYFAYDQFVMVPKNDEATQQYLTAAANMSKGKDSLALGGKSLANPGFLGTYDNYPRTKSGKLAAYDAAVIEFKQGKYQKAYDMMDHFSSDNKILMALKYGVMADSKANLKQGDDALSLMQKAIGASDDPYTAYFFTKKAGLLAIALKKKSDAKKYFESIDKNYKDYDQNASDAYIEMVKYY